MGRSPTWGFVARREKLEESLEGKSGGWDDAGSWCGSRRPCTHSLAFPSESWWDHPTCCPRPEDEEGGAEDAPAELSGRVLSAPTTARHMGCHWRCAETSCDTTVKALGFHHLPNLGNCYRNARPGFYFIPLLRFSPMRCRGDRAASSAWGSDPLHKGR